MRPSRAPSNGSVPRAQPRARADLTQSPAGRRLPPAQWWWRRAPWLFVAGACLFGLLTLSGELTTVAPPNDESVHLEMVRWAVQQIHEGNLVPLDGWFPYLSLGDAQFSHYQSLPHLITAYFSLIFGVDTAVHWAGYLLFALFPLSVYAGSRLLGWSRWAAGGAALVTPLLVSVTGYGYESFSYTWLGNGLWSQEWGMFLLPLAWGLSWRAVNGTGRGKYALAALVVGLTIGSALPHRVFRAAVDRRLRDRRLARVVAARRTSGIGVRRRRARRLMGGGTADHGVPRTST